MNANPPGGALTFAATLLWAGLAASEQAAAVEVPDFVEEALAAGVDHTYTGPTEFFVGGGVAVFDCDGDRRPDLFMAGGTNPVSLYRNRSAVGGALSFETVALGIDEEDRTNVLGAYPIDIDNDGYQDLVLLRLGANVVLKGGADCTFTKANDAWALAGGDDWTTAFSATFETGQTFPTLAIGNYIDRTASGPLGGACADSWLLRPAAGPVPSYGAPTALTPAHCTLSMLFTDWYGSGTRSLRATNDGQYHRDGEEQMWRVEPGLPPELFTADDGWRRLSIWGGGIAEGDIDADGHPEYALTSMGGTMLQRLDEEADPDRPVYQDIAFAAVAAAELAAADGRPSTGWHGEFDDVNNDGLLDLFVSKGSAEALPGTAGDDPNDLLLGQWDGTFVEVGGEAGVASRESGRGAAVVDLNLDGKLDIVVVNREAPASLFRNLGARTEWGHRPLGNWLAVEVNQPGGNRNAVGALISVRVGGRTITRTIAVGGGHGSGQAGFAHIGIGPSERAEVRVRWPDGDWSHVYQVMVNNFIRIERGKPAAGYWMPPPVSVAAN